MKKREILIPHERLRELREQGMNISADVYAYRMEHGSCLFLALTAIISFLYFFSCAGTKGILPALNGTFFTCGVFILLRSFLPTAFFIRVRDIVRYRYAFISLSLIGILFLLASPAYLDIFMQLNRASLTLSASVFCPFLFLIFLKHDHRGLLFVTFLFCGFLMGIHPIGIVAFLSLVALISFALHRSNRAQELSPFDPSYGARFMGEMAIVFESLNTLFSSFILMFVAALLGAVVSLGVQFYIEGAFSLKGFLGEYLQTLKGLYSQGSIIRTAAGFVLCLIAVVRSRSATDIEDMKPMTVTELMGYGIILFVSAFWPFGIVERLPVFSTLFTDALRHQSFLPDLLTMIAFSIACGVFLIELCCRQDDMAEAEIRINRKRRYAPSRFMRKAYAFVFISISMAVVGFAAWRTLSTALIR